MRIWLSSALVILSLAALAQEPAKTGSACYKDKSVDEYIAELNKREKGSHNPLPNDICIFGMCRQTGVGPGPTKPAPPSPEPKQVEIKPERESGDTTESSSKKEDLGLAGSAAPDPAARSYDPVSAARDADVGDYYFRQKNYRGALMRYTDAAKEKPGDAAIHLRLARAWEKLGAPERAYLEYDAVGELGAEGKTASEATDGMERLRPVLQKAGVDPATLVAESQPEKAPCLAAPKSSR